MLQSFQAQLKSDSVSVTVAVTVPHKSPESLSDCLDDGLV